MNLIKQNIISLFAISEEQADLFLSHFSLITLKQDEVFIEEGKLCHKVGLIEQGLMKCVYNHDGKEVVEEFVFENSFVSNYYSFYREGVAGLAKLCILEFILLNVFLLSPL